MNYFFQFICIITTEEKEQEAAEISEDQGKRRRYFRRKYGWATAAKERSDYVLSDPDLVFKNGQEEGSTCFSIVVTENHCID